MTQLKASFLTGISLCLLLLSACNLSTPSQVKTGDIQLKDVMKTATLDQAHVDAEILNIIAEDYERNGDGPVRLVIPYRPGNPVNRVAAEAQGARYKQALGKYNIKPLVAVVANADAGARAVLSYMALAAEPPVGCRPLVGTYGGGTLADTQKATFGCEIKTAQSRMVSRPADLLGVAGTADDDGRRHGAIVDHYRSGTPNPPLQGLTVSSGGG